MKKEVRSYTKAGTNMKPLLKQNRWSILRKDSGNRIQIVSSIGVPGMHYVYSYEYMQKHIHKKKIH